MSLGLIQGHDTVPQEVFGLFGKLFADSIPGWLGSGEYNFRPAAATQLIAAQLDIPMQSGSHIWINDALKDLLGKFDKLTQVELAIASKTERMAALVNFLGEASSPDVLLNRGAKTGGFIGYLSKSDPDLISIFGRAPTTAEMRAYATNGLSWDNILGSAAGKDVLALKPRIDEVTKKLIFDGKLSNGGFFSKTSTELNAGAWRELTSSQFSEEYKTLRNIQAFERGGVTVAGEAVNFGRAEAVLATVLEDGKVISSYAKAPFKLLKFLKGSALGVGVSVAAMALFAVSAEAKQTAQGYNTTKSVKENKDLIVELFATSTSGIAGLVAGALAGAATAGILAIPVGAGASYVGDAVGRQIAEFFYDNFTDVANKLAEWAAELLAPIGKGLVSMSDAIGEVAGLIFNAVTNAFEYVSDKVVGTDGLFGLNGPIFGAGGPLHSVVDIAKSFGFLTHDGTWAYDGFDTILYGTDGDDILIHDGGTGQALGGKGDDVLIAIGGKALAAGDPLFDDTTTPVAKTAQHLTLDGGDGNDWVLAFGGTSAADPQYAGLFNDGKSGTVTIGGAGRDWIYNTSSHGVIYGDTVDGLDPLTHQTIVSEVRASSPNDKNGAWNKFSDNIWWSGGTTVMDAGHNDVLKFFGMPLVGGDSSGGLALQALGGPVGGLLGVAIGSAQTYVAPEDTYYFDDLFSFITYKMDFTHGRHDMLVINEFEQLFSLTFSAFAGSVPDFNSGIMRIKNFDFVGSYTGLGQLALTNSTNYDDHGTFNMQFKKANPIWAVLAALPDSAIQVGLTGGGNAFGPLIDILFTASASLVRSAKANSWSTGGDPLVLDLAGRGLNSTSLDGSEVHFDLNNDFFAERTGWVGAGAGLLALDKNGNGKIDDVTELFGSYTGSGLGDLATYDLNHDGRIDAGDQIFSTLKVWQDANGDGLTQTGELQSLSQLGIASISLNGQAVNGTTPQGTEIRTYSTFTRTDGSTSGVYDAVFGNDQTDTVYRGESGQARWMIFGTPQQQVAQAANDNIMLRRAA